MSALTALLIFVGIPVAFALVLWTLLSIKSWSSSSAATTVAGAYDPFLVVTGPALPDPARLPRDLDVPGMNLVGGGARGNW